MCHDDTAVKNSSYLLAMGKEHAADNALASPATQMVPGPHAVTTRLVSYHTVNGREVSGYLAQPSDVTGPVPGVLVFHEWWGLNANIEAMTRQLASQGYAAFAVDLYNGEKATTPEQAMGLMKGALGDAAGMQANFTDGYAVLSRMVKAPKIATLGWCFGGKMSLASALALGGSKLAAAVIYYGQLETDPEKLKPLTMPVLGLFGGADKGITPDSVHAFEAALKANHTPAEIHIYEGAGHAFANPSGANYQAAAAEDAWARTTAFLAKTLQ